MSDKYLNFVNSAWGRTITKRLGLPQPVQLDRYREGAGPLSGSTIIDASEGAVFARAIRAWADGNPVPVYASHDFDASQKLRAVVYDASGITQVDALVQLHQFFNPILRSFGKCTRVVVVGLIPEHCCPSQQIAQRALLGFVKALAKEMRLGGTVNLLWVQPGAERELLWPLSFLASDRSAYVSGQPLRVRRAESEATLDFARPLIGRNVLITGAARGIGRSIAQLMQRRGAHVSVLDIPRAEVELTKLAAELKGDWLTLDVTDGHAAQQIGRHFAERPLHAIIHNAGITRDKKLANMQTQAWHQVLNTNLACQERINQNLIETGVLQRGSGIVLVSSISGIGGIAGQTNYSASKAGVIGMVDAYAESYFQQGIALNAVAPGFIDTEMIATIPLALREAGRRMNSLAQAGLPVDVAETIAMLAQGVDYGLYGNVLRVCGQAVMGA
ncbi:MAG: 3-oxoacyl-ACP reductase [Pirellulaceae bacterium]|nr:3-oxoacyl-ACP reductase [Pirellulaceae bacterium]